MRELPSRLNKNHPQKAVLHRDIGSVLQCKGQLDEALKEYRTCQVMQEAALGSAHPDVGSTHFKLGGLLVSRGNGDGGLSEFTKCFDIRQAAFGGDHPDTILASNALGIYKGSQRAQPC